jgi:hypothetical protein
MAPELQSHILKIRGPGMIRINRNSGSQTCIACPAQWEFKTDDGEYVYIRYRGGAFSAKIGSTRDSAVSGELLVFGDFGDSLDGYMTTEEMEELLKIRIEFYG